ncbi:uncharacterized protein PAE49_006944 [Odontesthes bonariensis]
MRLSQKKRKQTKTVKTSVGDAGISNATDLDNFKDGRSDADDESRGSSPDMRLSQKKRKQTKTVKTSVGDAGISNATDLDNFKDGRSDADDESRGSSPDMRLSQKKRKQTKTVKTSDARSDLLRQVRLEPQTEDEKSDTDDQGPGPNVIERKSRERPKSKEIITKARRGWSEAERTAVCKHLDAFIKQRRVPGKEACMNCIKEEKVLGKRTWKDVKNFVYNRIVTLNRKSASRNLKF